MPLDHTLLTILVLDEPYLHWLLRTRPVVEVDPGPNIFVDRDAT